MRVVTIVPDVAGRFLGAVWDEDNVDELQQLLRNES